MQHFLLKTLYEEVRLDVVIELKFIFISALFWDITRRRVVIVYRRFGTTYRSHLKKNCVEAEENGRFHTKMATFANGTSVMTPETIFERQD
jgi:hypothetical protein